MKRFTCTFSLCCLLALFLPVSVIAGGIKTAADLVEFATALNSGQSTEKWRNEKGEVCLEADIDMVKVKKFESISSFGGVFDGKGYSIKNWKAKSGLFDQLLQGGIIRNLTIDKSCSMKAENKNELYFCGFIANSSNGQIENCNNYGSIVHKSKYTERCIYLGGVVGSSRWALLNCNNYGDISSDCVSTLQKWDVSINIGGVAGGGFSKLEAKPSVSWCCNYGKITYSGDFPVVNVAGVIGSCEKNIPVKYCVNRGEVNVWAQAYEGDWKIRKCYVGGICSFTKGNVMDCDNFGKVLSQGTHTTAVGGIVANPHGAVVISGCVNYGYVTLTATVPSDLGGIVGTSRRAVHINNCHNRGEVIYDGYSPDKPSRIGGIIGLAYTVGDAGAAAYIRSCVNYGKVFSGTGGNNYENHLAIRTGGIAGTVRGNSKHQVELRDCANKGDVSSIGGKCNPIAASAENAQIAGEYYDSYAHSAEPAADGSNVFGKVLTDDGQPLAGVVVSDGFQCVATDADGNYRMNSRLEDVKFVMVSPPSGYEAEMLYSVPQMFKRVRRYEKAVKADFTLKHTGDKDEYTMVIIGDPQMRGLNSDGSGERFRDVIIPDIEQLKGDKKDFYAVNVGDLVYNWMRGYDDFVDISATATFPMYNVIGNHDVDQDNMYDVRLGTVYYENYIAPTYYSFNIGKVHYVVMNNILTDGKRLSKKGYWYGIVDEQLEWFKNDLSYVSDDMTVVICTHSYWYQKNQNHLKYRNYKAFRAELERFDKVYAWAGHSHWNGVSDYTWEGGKITAAMAARCSGSLRFNREMLSDGTPNGYLVATVKGGDITWYYKSVGHGQEHQMRVYSPLKTKDGYVKATIWNHSADCWANPEWWENGVKIGELEHVKEADIAYMELYEGWKGQNLKNFNYATPQNARVFRIKPSEGVRKGEVRVTDNFGVTYTQTIEW